MGTKILMVDLAREQAPTRDHLYRYAALALDSGYTGLGLYLEHRFAYPSAPWAHGKGCVTPEAVRSLQSEFPSLQVIPFINLLGHMEGFLYAHEGKSWRAEPFKGLQASPTAPGFREFAEGILEDTLAAFSSELIHIGGDETAQLDAHPRDKARAEAHQGDGKAHIYASHFGPLLDRVVRAGRTPGLWGDMLLEHPEALPILPRQTVLFDWQYFNGLKESAPKLQELGFKVVGCPALHIYNSVWEHLEQGEQNIREVSRDARDLGLEGVCLTVWEFGLFGAADSHFGAIAAASRIMDDPDGPHSLLDGYPAEDGGRRWAELMGIELGRLGGPFAPRRIRDSLKCRLLLYRNPFLAWMHHGEELAGPMGDEALALLEKAMIQAPGEAEKAPVLFARSAIEFVRFAERAHQHYLRREPEKAVAALAPSRLCFDNLEKIARLTHERIGGSLADIERCRAAREHVEVVIRRIRAYGNGELGYLPAFDILTNPRFVPHDQGSWWLINRWANE